MKLRSGQIHLTASDLTGHLSCAHLTQLDVAVARGERARPARWDPIVEILRERGLRHERAYIEHLECTGHTCILIDGSEIDDGSVEMTLDAMRRGAQVIVQAALREDRWSGRADILRRIDVPSALGPWSYEVVDTKLARETTGTTVLQLCLYSMLLESAQGVAPQFAYVVVPRTDFAEQRYRMADYAAFFRKACLANEQAVALYGSASYPEPNPHCDNCRWSGDCEAQLRKDDSLTYVAGILKSQINELREKGINKLAALADLNVPLPWKLKRGADSSYAKIARQADIQRRARETGNLLHELLPVEQGLGLGLLPEPSAGDIFFDLEGDPFAGESGLEYLFGYCTLAADGTPVYEGRWALNLEEEKAAFEGFVDLVSERLRTYPDLHIYHYAPYEPAALKRLMGRYASRENEIDDLLRGHRFVDLYSAVRHALRASVESYSIKRLEPFYKYVREVPLRDANVALAAVQAGLELGDQLPSNDPASRLVQGYNRDDCISTLALRGWLEALRSELETAGTPVPRPVYVVEAPREDLTDRLKLTAELREQLSQGVPLAASERTPSQHASWILGNILDWHRREDKATHWEGYRLAELVAEDLFDERAGLAGLSFLKEVPAQGGRMPVHRYHFPPQDTDLRPGKKLKMVGGESYGEVIDISPSDRTIDIKKTGKTSTLHADAAYTHEFVPSEEQAASLLRIGEYVAANGIEGDGPYFAARRLLLRSKPDVGGEPMQMSGEAPLEGALRLAGAFSAGVLPVQGPPGTGKSHTGARMICRFVQNGLRVGVTATSHKVIRNLLDKVVEASVEMGVELKCIQKPKEMEDDRPKLVFAKSNEALLGALASGQCHVAGATSFLWSREDAADSIDVLVVDEAAQVSLANVLAVSPAARRLVLLGDPQQLDEPTQGTHPEGTGGSSLEYMLNGRQTIHEDEGLFLGETWRMHPDICKFDSDLFYEGKLSSLKACAQQRINAKGPWSETGLRYLAVPHKGNKSSSIEEADAVAQLVTAILKEEPTWIDREGKQRLITLADIIIITPYNAQVFEIQQRLPGAKVGTVDKFQGQEEAIAIYSMATSSYADAPRGMEFLYSANRFNVAISRAKCLAILVASPDVFEAECRTPRQMQLANAFCHFLEVGTPIAL